MMKKRLSGIIMAAIMLCLVACGKDAEDRSEPPVNDTAVLEQESEEKENTEPTAEVKKYVSIKDKMEMKIEELLNSDTEKIPQDEITLSYQGNSVVVHKFDMDMDEIIQLFDSDGSSETLSVDKDDNGFIRFIRFVDPSKNYFLLENKYTSKDLTEIAVDHISISQEWPDVEQSPTLNGVALGITAEDAIAILGKPDNGTIIRPSSLYYMCLEWFYELDGREVKLRLEYIEGADKGSYALNCILVYF